MPTTYSFDSYIQLIGVGFSRDGVVNDTDPDTLSWNSFNVVSNNSNATDNNDDMNVDSVDTFPANNSFYSGWSVTAPNGATYAIYGEVGIGFFIPFNASAYDLGAVLPSNGQTMQFTAEDFEPTGNPLCFGAGTMIATPEGTVAVEALSIGDPVLTADGRAVPVKWVGRQTHVPLFQRLRLIRIGAGALGEGLPAHDLVLTADHALMLQGVLVNAGVLVNGTTVTEVPASQLPERVTVYHIETEDHEIILAEGAPAETYIDYAGRRAFDNYAEYVALYGADRAIAENPAPRISSARMLPAALCARLGIRRAA